ncbi:hypothetical protein A6R68_02253 [Neotoma lepida]|uniref:Uncharacterized protein n=1 Tax=Neotoma lepida TaxID=56216 RepID=A0A1A6GSR2_NEOLE|nr:hypothetical protein A6R68_02253 [Neotoma lepida]
MSGHSAAMPSLLLVLKALINRLNKLFTFVARADYRNIEGSVLRTRPEGIEVIIITIITITTTTIFITIITITTTIFITIITITTTTIFITIITITTTPLCMHAFAWLNTLISVDFQT